MKADQIVLHTVYQIFMEAGAERTEGEEGEYSERIGNILLRLNALEQTTKEATLRELGEKASTEWLVESNEYLESKGFNFRF